MFDVLRSWFTENLHTFFSGQRHVDNELCKWKASNRQRENHTHTFWSRHVSTEKTVWFGCVHLYGEWFHKTPESVRNARWTSESGHRAGLECWLTLQGEDMTGGCQRPGIAACFCCNVNKEMCLRKNWEGKRKISLVIMELCSFKCEDSQLERSELATDDGAASNLVSTTYAETEHVHVWTLIQQYWSCTNWRKNWVRSGTIIQTTQKGSKAQCSQACTIWLFDNYLKSIFPNQLKPTTSLCE